MLLNQLISQAVVGVFLVLPKICLSLISLLVPSNGLLRHSIGDVSSECILQFTFGQRTKRGGISDGVVLYCWYVLYPTLLSVEYACRTVNWFSLSELQLYLLESNMMYCDPTQVLPYDLGKRRSRSIGDSDRLVLTLLMPLPPSPTGYRGRIGFFRANAHTCTQSPHRLCASGRPASGYCG